MKDIKPVAWVVSDGAGQFIATEQADLATAQRFNWPVTPLYALPEGYVIVPKEKIKEAVFDGFMASGEGYNGEHCGRLDSEEQAREIADAWIGSKLEAAQEEG